MKLEHVTPAESAEVLKTLATSMVHQLQVLKSESISLTSMFALDILKVST